MSRQPSANAAPMTPVTPVWADRLRVAQQPLPSGALLPSAFEITPPQTAPRKSAYAVAMSATGPSLAPGAPGVPQPGLHAFAAPDALSGPVPTPAHAVASMPLCDVSPQYAMSQVSMPHLTPMHGGVASHQSMSSPMMPMMSVMGSQPRAQRVGSRPGVMPAVPLAFVSPTQDMSSPSHARTPLSGARIPPGRVTKGSTPGPKPHMAAPESDPFAVDFKKRYAAYNQYIMRQTVEETDQAKVIWPPDVELAFMEAVWLVPGVQRHKILVDRRHRGRNELIADYVEYKTGQARTRKQVSSHLQVLKKLLKEDAEFLQLLKPRDEPGKSLDDKPGPEMAVKSLAHLVSKMRAAKGGAPEPAFLLQAQANYTHSLMKKKQRDQETSSQPQHQGSISSSMVDSVPLRTQPPQVTNTAASAAGAARQHPSPPSSAMPMAPARIGQSANSTSADTATQALPDAPLLHPKPVHHQEAFCDPVIAPAASVPPEDSLVALVEPPQTQFKRRHRRTASTSIDLGSDRGLPVVFRMARRSNHGVHMYTRLLRACYESPGRPKPINQLLGKFSELEVLQRSGLLNGTQVVHAHCSLHLAAPSGSSSAMPSDYSSDVQFVLAMDGAWQHRYVVRTVVCSRGQELLRSETPCTFQRILGRGREQDCEAVNVPFRADFWGDFLNRLEHCEPGYATAAIEALAVTQCVYRVTQAAEELCIVSVYEFGVASDEFSARTRFRRVRTSHSNEREEPNTPTRRASDNSTLDTPKHTPTRNAATPTQSGPLGTPSFNMGVNIANVLGYESPAVFGSPRRPIQTLDIDVSLSPFDFGESRGSPRASKFEIQRSMTAFEPAAWEDIHDWMFS